MKLKSIEMMNFYEVLNVSQSASQQDIERAYKIALFSYEKNSLAHYTLVDEDQRKRMLHKINEAYEILSDPQKRKEYDQKSIKQKSQSYHNSYFRSSTERLFIDDGEKGITKVIKNIKASFNSDRLNKKK